MNCYRHPERTTRRRCYQCKTPICAECQVKLDHHYFCSEQCHEKWRLQKEEKASKKRAKARKRSVRRSFDPEAKISFLENKLGEITGEHQLLELKFRRFEYEQRNRTRKILLTAGLASALLIALFLGVIIYLGPKKPEQMILSSAQNSPPRYDPGYPSTLSEAVFLEPPSLELPPGEIKTEQGMIDLYGRAPGARKVLLLLNGREYASLLLSQPEFVFQKVSLGEGTNLVQVLAEDENHNQAFSIAQVIEYSKQGSSRVAYTPGLDYTHGARDFPGIALTFDAGGEAGYAARMLEILRKQGVRATIFVTGQFIKDYPALVRQMVEDGHEIGNHTYSHPHLTTWEQNSHHWTAPGVTKEFVQAELLNTAALFRETTGAEMAPLWRAPYGEHNREIRRWAEEVGFYHIGWSRSPKRNYDTLDWLMDTRNKYYRSSEQIREMLVNLARLQSAEVNGAIVLMHLSTDRSDKFPEQVLEPALEAFSARGYRIAKVSELFPALTGK